MEAYIDIILFSFLIITAIGIMILRDLFAVVMLSGVFSLLSAALFVAMDAVDVAFTEAAVGAGISTVLMLGTMALTSRQEKPPTHSRALPLLVAFITGAALLYGTADLPPFGAPDTPIQMHVAPEYIARTPTEIGVPNIVTAVLASYRGFDTLGETAVVFIAGIAVIFLLHQSSRRRRDDENDEEEV
ncbi:MAG: DUF4040 domain-containing protein [Alphaproteobacteria bacterium]|nr:DUF4040 domain-containing protein [Alphaproteobacteria bacterium]MBO6629106.1 DUF4040 domain-containing protein [Alphaproteobacteria bacterium]MDF1624891.1 DUF4040 domain-containing protein [Parvibaculaceae bacterium]